MSFEAWVNICVYLVSSEYTGPCDNKMANSERPQQHDNEGFDEEIEEMKNELISLMSEELDVNDPQLEKNRWDMQKESNQIIDQVVRY